MPTVTKDNVARCRARDRILFCHSEGLNNGLPSQSDTRAKGFHPPTSITEDHVGFYVEANKCEKFIRETSFEFVAEKKKILTLYGENSLS